ncbi:MAG: heme-binding domain-containing protein [Acidobacteriota bacterium]
MKTRNRILIGVPAFLLLIQFLGPEKSNPPIDPLRTIEAHLKITSQVSAIFERACQNCHSHKTEWPWYSNVAPVSWFVIDNVNFGRSIMNLSDWAQYDGEEVIRLLEQNCELVKAGEMPIVPYQWMHDESHLGEQDIQAICEWAEGEQRRLMQAE